MKDKGRNKKNEGYKCVVKKVQVEWYTNLVRFWREIED
jgi:hypothetical protein